MKLITVKLAAIILLICCLSCRKILASMEGKTCWKCHVKGTSTNGEEYDYSKTKCVEDGPPQFYDDNGNQQSATCEKL